MPPEGSGDKPRPKKGAPPRPAWRVSTWSRWNPHPWASTVELLGMRKAGDLPKDDDAAPAGPACFCQRRHPLPVGTRSTPTRWRPGSRRVMRMVYLRSSSRLKRRNKQVQEEKSDGSTMGSGPGAWTFFFPNPSRCCRKTRPMAPGHLCCPFVAGEGRKSGVSRKIFRTLAEIAPRSVREGGARGFIVMEDHRRSLSAGWPPRRESAPGSPWVPARSIRRHGQAAPLPRTVHRPWEPGPSLPRRLVE
jgi:hypothetical protein